MYRIGEWIEINFTGLVLLLIERITEASDSHIFHKDKRKKKTGSGITTRDIVLKDLFSLSFFNVYLKH